MRNIVLKGITYLAFMTLLICITCTEPEKLFWLMAICAGWILAFCKANDLF